MGVKLTSEMIEGSQYTAKEYGVPASVTLGQIMLESGGSYTGGLSGLAYKYNNLFGITKGSNWSGDTVTMTNKAGKDKQIYRVYSSVKASIIDHAKVLSASRYAATKKAKNVSEYVDAIVGGGYAADPDYAKKLKKIIKDNHLTAYDSDGWQGKGDIVGDNDSVGDKAIPLEPGEVGEGNTKVKWWGEILILVLTILVACGAITFFIFAFSKKGVGVLAS